MTAKANKAHGIARRVYAREATIILDMLDPKNPIIRRLRKRGFKVSAQAHLLDDDQMTADYIAWNPETKQKFQSRSTTGDWPAALAELNRQARLGLR